MKPIEILVYLHQTLGIGGLIAGLIILGLCVLCYEILKHFVMLFISTKFPNLHKHKNPLKSAFFNKMQILIYYKVPRLVVECPLRKAIFKKLLRIAFETWSTRAKEKAVNPEIDKLNTEEYLNFWKSFIYKTTDLWEAKAIQEGIPQIAVEKYRKIHNKTLDLIIGIVEQICGSVNVYDSSTDKTIAILDFIAMLLDMAIIDAETTILEINGELSKVTYEGIACQQCNQECLHRVKKYKK